MENAYASVGEWNAKQRSIGGSGIVVRQNSDSQNGIYVFRFSIVCIRPSLLWVGISAFAILHHQQQQHIDTCMKLHTIDKYLYLHSSWIRNIRHATHLHVG